MVNTATPFGNGNYIVKVYNYCISSRSKSLIQNPLRMGKQFDVSYQNIHRLCFKHLYCKSCMVNANATFATFTSVVIILRSEPAIYHKFERLLCLWALYVDLSVQQYCNSMEKIYSNRFVSGRTTPLKPRRLLVANPGLQQCLIMIALTITMMKCLAFTTCVLLIIFPLLIYCFSQ